MVCLEVLNKDLAADCASKLTCLRNSDLTRAGRSILCFLFLFLSLLSLLRFDNIRFLTNLFRKYMTCTSVSEVLPGHVRISRCEHFFFYT